MPKRPETFTLHCDVCGEDTKYLGQMERRHIGTPCPACSADTLTEGDYRTGIRVLRVIKVLEFLGLAKRVQPGEEAPSHLTHEMRVKVHNGVKVTTNGR